MLEFLLALLTTATVAALLWPLLRMRQPARDRLSGELAIYRDQLAELERERAAGTLPTAEAAAARTEIERRMLAAGDAAASSAQATGKTARASDAVQKWLPPALSLFVPLLALGLYLQTGRPGLPAAPFADRGTEHPAPSRQLDVAGLLAEARARLAQDPNDADALAALAEGLTLEAGGTVTQPALEALQRALKTRPDDARILYYLGLHEAQSGDSKAALARWREVEAGSPPDAPWLPMLRAEIARVAKAAGIEVPPAAAAPPSQMRQSQAPQSTMPQPSREQQEAMAQLSPEQQQQAIRTMVEGLAARLAAAPQDRAGWLRLANAWKVLGEHANAADAYARAETLAPVDARILADWAEAHVRQLAPGAVPSPQAVTVLERLEKAEPRNALALFYLGVAAEAAGNKPAALQRWKTLLALLPADAPIRVMLEERIKAAGG